MLDLDQAIRERHSTRLFLPQPVPRELVNEALALAQYAPSNSNIQPQSAIPIQNFPQINYTSPASQSGRTWFSSTTNPRKPSLIPFGRSYSIARKCGTPMYVSVSS